MGHLISIEHSQQQFQYGDTMIESLAALRAGHLIESPRLLLIDGRWQAALSGKTFESINPATGQAFAHVADGGPEDIELAVAAARRAFDDGPWRKFKPYDRQQVILKLADLVDANFEELSYLATHDMGAPIKRTLGLRRRMVGMLRYYAGMTIALHGETIDNSIPGDFQTYTLKEPVGVVGAISPWNGPLNQSVWKIGPVLATGCTMVYKPAAEAPLVALRFAELCHEAGVPPGVVNVVTGGGAAGAALAAHPDVDKIAFTGSTATGQQIIHAAAGNIKRLSLELGGKSPNIVFADADLDVAVAGAAQAVFTNSGQICSAGTRLFVERPIYDEFVERVAAYASRLRLGNPLDESTDLGPLASAAHLDRVCGYLAAGQQDGARLLTGGARAAGEALSKGYYVPPTVFGHVKDDMRIAQEEIFGPVLSTFAFDSTEEVVKRANSLPFGLGSGVWTRDVKKAHRIAKQIRSGMVWINCYQATDPAVPFGGYKMSGLGRESGTQHFDDYLNVKAVTSDLG
jgi:aldehyde dehydrogenase (NAD+)